MLNTRAFLPDWLDAPAACYEDLLKAQRFIRSTRKVYLSMFTKFCTFLNLENIRLDRCTYQHIDAFFTENEIQKHQRYRYIRVIEKVYDHLIEHNPHAGLSNPARLAAKEKLAEGANDPMNFLTDAEIGLVDSYLAKPPCVEKNAKKIKKTEWKESRDQAITAVMLFGAVKVSEVQALTVNCVYENGRELLIKAAYDDEKPALQRGVEGFEKASGPEQATGSESAEKTKPRKKRDAHTALLLPEGWESLRKWIALRDKVVKSGDVLFPASPDGEPMHPASIYRGVMKILKCAGVNVEQHSRIAPQTLRNTYAVLMMDLDTPYNLIQDSMGLHGDNSMPRIKGNYEVWFKKN